MQMLMLVYEFKAHIMVDIEWHTVSMAASRGLFFTSPNSSVSLVCQVMIVFICFRYFTITYRQLTWCGCGYGLSVCKHPDSVVCQPQISGHPNREPQFNSVGVRNFAGPKKWQQWPAHAGATATGRVDVTSYRNLLNTAFWSTIKDLEIGLGES